MLYHGSKAGAFDLKSIVLECLTAMRRAGIAMMVNVITWFVLVKKNWMLEMQIMPCKTIYETVK